MDATRPLLLEHGPAISTRRIAEAAGVAEGTIFRVFESKDELLHACVVDALSPNDFIEQLDAVAPASDLGGLLVAAASGLIERGETIRTLIGMLHGQYRLHPAPTDGDQECARPDPRQSREQVLDALVDALTPHAEELRVTPRDAARTLMALTFGATHTLSGNREFEADQIADLVLHGIGAAR